MLARGFLDDEEREILERIRMHKKIKKVAQRVSAPMLNRK